MPKTQKQPKNITSATTSATAEEEQEEMNDLRYRVVNAYRTSRYFATYDDALSFLLKISETIPGQQALLHWSLYPVDSTFPAYEQNDLYKLVCTERNKRDDDALLNRWKKE
jgi:hypothetical protein